MFFFSFFFFLGTTTYPLLSMFMGVNLCAFPTFANSLIFTSSPKHESEGEGGRGECCVFCDAAQA